MKNKTLPYLSGRFFDGISSGLFMMALPWIMLKEPDMGTFVALTALFCTVLSFCCTPFFSTLTARHSRKQILIMVQLAQTSTAMLVFIAWGLGVGSNWVLAAAQVIFWVSSNVAWNVNNAFTQENYQRHEYARISDYQEVIMQGTTLGAGAGGILLLEWWGISEFSLFAAVASGISAIAYILTPYHQKLRQSDRQSFFSQLRESKTIFMQNPPFYGFLLVSCLSYPVLTFLGKLVPIWFAELKVSGDWVAMYNMAFGLGSLVTGFLIYRILSRVEHRLVMQYSMMALSVILLLMSGLMQPYFIVLLTFCFGFFNALNRIARTNWMHHVIPIDQRGRVDDGLAMFSTAVQSLSYVLIAFFAHFHITEYSIAVVGLLVLCSSLWMTVLGSNTGLSEAKEALNQT